MRLILFTVVLVLCATVASEFIYWHMLVPRLPHFLRVPILWWIAVFTPFGVASLFIGSFITSPRFILVHGIVASFVAIGGRIIFLFASGRPPGHDVSWQDMVNPSQFQLTLISLVVLAILFSVAISAGYAFRSQFKTRVS